MFKEKVTAEQVVIVIPMYRDYLSAYEEISLNQCFKVLGNYKVIVIKPRSLKLTVLNNYPAITYKSFNDNCFLGVDAYSQLLMSEKFYQEFLNYTYMLVYQLDAFVFRDDLLNWCNKHYDYIGAPWLKYNNYKDVFHWLKSRLMVSLNIRLNKKEPGTDLPAPKQFENMVGNGGLSLRRVQQFYQLSKRYADHFNHNFLGADNWLPEDVFWSISINREAKNLLIPEYKEAIRFSFENYPERALNLTKNELPFGCHAWHQHKTFWKDIFANMGYFI
jgi:hypothetical protein